MEAKPLRRANNSGFVFGSFRKTLVSITTKATVRSVFPAKFVLSPNPSSITHGVQLPDGTARPTRETPDQTPSIFKHIPTINTPSVEPLAEVDKRPPSFSQRLLSPLVTHLIPISAVAATTTMSGDDEPLTYNEMWDDSMLVNSWNQALEEYKVSRETPAAHEARSTDPPQKYHSIHAKGIPLDEVLE